MKDVQFEFREDTGITVQINRNPKPAPHDGSAGIDDSRLVRLLLVLSELDESVASLGGLPQADLEGVVSDAIQACGFTNPAEVRNVVATVLQALGVCQVPRVYTL
ncbi:MAG TPA: hypothetical protein VMT67_03215 [Terriglobales bacterium]|nr:hypothetical protein [Terriglobales bacterium]